MRLKDRQRQIPGGSFYYVPETRFKIAEWTSFQSIVDQLIQHRQGNPAMTAKHGWSTDRATVENEVDSFLANVCAQMGHTNFILSTGGGSPPPKLTPPSQTDLSQLSAVGAKVRNIWAGIKNVGEWIDSNAPTVSQELADARAPVCVECQKNGGGDFGKWFIAPVAGAIKRQVEKLNARGLKTPLDDRLGVCDACTCAMKVKVWEPMDFIKRHTSDETLDKLRTAVIDKNNKPMVCWVIAELAKE